MRTEHSPANGSVPVSSFFETGREELGLQLVAGASGMRRRIIEAALNRPGLAFSGFFKHFAHKRVQVIGMAEHAYLGSFSPEEREIRLREFFCRKVPCVVLTRHRKVFPEMKTMADQYGVPVIRTGMITKHFINAATIIMENLMAPHMKVQGTMVEIMGIGVLIEGKAGMGKSETALGLIKRGHALVSDDVTAIRVDSSGRLIAAPVSIMRYHMEIRGVGIIHVPSLFGVSAVREEKRLDLVATLFEPGTREDEERGGGMNNVRVIMDVPVPQVLIRVAPGRDLCNLIEAAALDMKLKRLGHDAAKELDERLVALLSGGHDGSE